MLYVSPISTPTRRMIRHAILSHTGPPRLVGCLANTKQSLIIMSHHDWWTALPRCGSIGVKCLSQAQFRN